LTRSFNPEAVTMGCFPLPLKNCFRVNNGYTAEEDFAWRIEKPACCPASS
jgi:hypothetical protein